MQQNSGLGCNSFRVNKPPVKISGLLFLVLFLGSLLVPALATDSKVALANDDGTLSGWSGWGHDLLNSRFSPFANGLNRSNVAQLKLKWAFVFPDTQIASSQPTVVDNTLYVGSWNGKVYALNAHNGKLKWSYDTASYTGPQPPGANGVRTALAVADGRVYFGDLIGNLYALDANNGQFRWATRVDTHPLARVTGSPIVWNGRVYVGVSSSETAAALDPTYPCCTFRGSLVAFNASTGAVDWRYYTINQAAQQIGTNAIGTPSFGPSGGPIWDTPAINPLTGLIYFGTGQNYSNPATPHTDSLIALDARTGQERWVTQLTPNDRWNVACNPELIGLPPGPYPNCPLPQGDSADFDIGYSPNLFVTVRNGQLRQLIGTGQKSGIYHALDAQTGQIVWQTQLSMAGAGGLGGIQWGGSWDGTRIYVPTNQANPGSLNALDPATGQVLWHVANPANGCSTGGAANDPVNCKLALPAATSSAPGLVVQGSQDGKLRIHDSRTGAIVWEYDTVRSFTGTNGLVGQGGSINGAGATIAGGWIYLNSGYAQYPGAGIPGNVLLAFS